jgi:hypothetical protein
MRKAAIATFAILTLAFVTLAHGNEKHVMGVVSKITDTEITVKTTDNQTQIVKISQETSFVKSGENATVKDLKVGDRVVIHAMPSGTDLVAHEVRFGKAPATAAK